jgi:hypothetical protein
MMKPRMIRNVPDKSCPYEKYKTPQSTAAQPTRDISKKPILVSVFIASSKETTGKVMDGCPQD